MKHSGLLDSVKGGRRGVRGERKNMNNVRGGDTSQINKRKKKKFEEQNLELKEF